MTGYAICNHIFEGGAPVAIVHHPDPKQNNIHATIGSICCAIAPSEHKSEDLTILCRYCAESRGFTKVAAVQ